MTENIHTRLKATLLNEARTLLFKINERFEAIDPYSCEGQRLTYLLYNVSDRYIRRYHLPD